jgi:hypothetical protein
MYVTSQLVLLLTALFGRSDYMKAIRYNIAKTERRFTFANPGGYNYT